MTRLEDCSDLCICISTWRLTLSVSRAVIISDQLFVPCCLICEQRDGTAICSYLVFFEHRYQHAIAQYSTCCHSATFCKILEDGNHSPGNWFRIFIDLKKQTFHILEGCTNWSTFLQSPSVLQAHLPNPVLTTLPPDHIQPDFSVTRLFAFDS